MWYRENMQKKLIFKCTKANIYKKQTTVYLIVVTLRCTVVLIVCFMALTIMKHFTLSLFCLHFEHEPFSVIFLSVYLRICSEPDIISGFSLQLANNVCVFVRTFQNERFLSRGKFPVFCTFNTVTAHL